MSNKVSFSILTWTSSSWNYVYMHIHAGYSNTIDRVGYNRPGQKFKNLLWGMRMIFIHINCMGYLQQILIKQSFKL